MQLHRFAGSVIVVLSIVNSCKNPGLTLVRQIAFHRADALIGPQHAGDE